MAGTGLTQNIKGKTSNNLDGQSKSEGLIRSLTVGRFGGKVSLLADRDPDTETSRI